MYLILMVRESETAMLQARKRDHENGMKVVITRVRDRPRVQSSSLQDLETGYIIKYLDGFSFRGFF
jgi:hypothetical protein